MYKHATVMLSQVNLSKLTKSDRVMVKEGGLGAAIYTEKIKI